MNININNCYESLENSMQKVSEVPVNQGIMQDLFKTNISFMPVITYNPFFLFYTQRFEYCFFGSGEEDQAESTHQLRRNGCQIRSG